MADIQRALESGDIGSLLQNPMFMEALQRHPQLLAQMANSNPALQQAMPTLLQRLQGMQGQEQAFANLQSIYTHARTAALSGRAFQPDPTIMAGAA